jgi:hypothetical protein
MSTLTIRIPEGKHARLRSLAKARGVSINRLMDELATLALAQHDTETRFRALAGRGSKRKGLAVLDKLDRAFANTPAGKDSG